MLQLAGINTEKDVKTPMATSYSESKNDHIKADKTNYMSLVGLLNYI